MDKAILHLGYPKTGTTFLQRKLFTQAANNYCVITPEFENCGINIKKLKQELQSGSVSRKMHGATPPRPLLFSMEGLLFDAVRRIRDGQFAPEKFSRSLAGLKSLCRDVREENIDIVLYLRRQDELIHSIYAESKTFHFNHIESMNSLGTYVDAILASDSQPEHPGYHYHFSNTLNDIGKVFSGSRIHVRFYENLSENLPSEIEFWSSLTGIKFTEAEGRENSRRMSESRKITDPGSLRVHAVSWKNKYLPDIKLPNHASRIAKGILNRVQFNQPELVELDSDLRRRIRQHFAAPNRELVLQLDFLKSSLPECYLQIEDLV